VTFLRGLVTAFLGNLLLGPWSGFWFGALVGVVTAVVASLEGAPDLAETPSAYSSLRRDLTVTIAKGVGFGATIGVPVAVFSAPAGLLAGMLLGLATRVSYGAGVAVAMNARGHWLVLTRMWLVVTRRLPFDVIGFLDDAHNKGVLRQIGGMWEFRHANLQQALASGRPHVNRDDAVGELQCDG
jgi:hypothetical protein